MHLPFSSTLMHTVSRPGCCWGMENNLKSNFLKKQKTPPRTKTKVTCQKCNMLVRLMMQYIWLIRFNHDHDHLRWRNSFGYAFIKMVYSVSRRQHHVEWPLLYVHQCLTEHISTLLSKTPMQLNISWRTCTCVANLTLGEEATISRRAQDCS